MRLHAKNLESGQVVRVEYGDYDNWVKFTIDEVHRFEHMVLAKGHTESVKADFSWKLDELVEVVI